jgi:transcriptional regulator with XRE-family HTH domain
MSTHNQDRQTSTATSGLDVKRIGLPDVYSTRPRVDYGDLMARDGRADEHESEWWKYLRTAMESRGWSVAELSRQTGATGQPPISRQSIFLWKANRHTPTPESVHQIAQTLGDTYENAMRAANPRGEIVIDSMLEGLDPNDPVVQRIYKRTKDPVRRKIMLDRRRALNAMRLEQDLKEVDFEFDMLDSQHAA